MTRTEKSRLHIHTREHTHTHTHTRAQSHMHARTHAQALRHLVELKHLLLAVLRQNIVRAMAQQTFQLLLVVFARRFVLGIGAVPRDDRLF